MKQITKRQHLRLDLGTRRRLEMLAERSGKSMSAVVRLLIEGSAIREMPTADYYAMTAELHAIGNNLNQIARIANITGQIDKTAYAQDAALLREAVLEIQQTVELR